MKKLLIIITFSFLISACKKDISSLNIDPKNPSIAPSGAFFSNAQKNLSDVLTSTNVNDNIFRLIVQYWQETTYTDESNYDIITRQQPNSLWNQLYRDIIRDIREAKRLIPIQIDNEGTRKNQLAIAEITEVMAWYYLVTTFGNIPYSQALDIAKTQPVYDDQKTIYDDLLSRLDAAIAKLDPASEGFGSADLLYGGDVNSWKLFGNSFKLKMGMTIADVDNAKAQQIVESAVQGGVFTSNASNAQFNYLSGPPNTNPVWEDLVQSNRKDFVGTSTLVNYMNARLDPRLDKFFTKDASGGYSGGDPGASSNYATFSKPSGLNRIFNGDATDIGRVANPDFPGMLLSYDEVEFYLAEAVERGYNVGGTAAEHYKNAVTASIEYWGGTAGEASVYLANPTVVYNPANYKQSIGEQKWLALYNRGWDEWIEWRRLDYPQLVAPATAESDIPKRFTYPIPEQNLNKTNYESAKAAMGDDNVAIKLFWDKN